MKKVIFLLVLVFLFIGCAQKQEIKPERTVPAGPPTEEIPPPPSQPPQIPQKPGKVVEEKSEELSVTFIDSTYRTAEKKTSGWFTTGQDADILLSGIDFDNTGGPLLFNHPGGIATDGRLAPGGPQQQPDTDME